MTEPYVMLSVKDSRLRGWLMWWRSNRGGLTDDVKQAGHYAKDDAIGLSYDSGSVTGRHDVAIPSQALDRLPRDAQGRVLSSRALRDLVGLFPAANRPARLKVEQ